MVRRDSRRESLSHMQTSEPLTAPYWRQQIEKALLAPIRSMRLAYLPLLMVYFAYGATGLVGVAQTFWIRKSLTWSPAELAALSVWFTLPWTIKMVFGALVDSVPLLGSQRRSYVFVGAGLIALSFVLLAGASGGWITVLTPNQMYVVGSLISVTGLVLQDVVADAMSTEVVPRHNPDGTPRLKQDIDQDLGMVQVLGRLALSFGIFSVAGLSGWLAQYLSYDKVFLLGLIVPVISVTGAVLVRLDTTERRPIDWRILGGGLAYGAVVIALGAGDIPYSQELIFLVSMGVVIWMLSRVTMEIDHATRMRVTYAAIIIFVFRAVPGVGDAYLWFFIDVLGFDEAFFGVLGQIGAGVGIVTLWMLSDYITRRPVAQVLLWITILSGVLSLPSLLLVFQLHHVTEQLFGIGAHGIALFDTIATSPFAQLSMIPLLTLVAIYAPPGHRATWFALMASLMNLALIAGQLQTKYLNLILTVNRGDYHNLPALVVVSYTIAIAMPLVAIAIFGRRVR
jgi:MFS family permease